MILGYKYHLVPNSRGYSEVSVDSQASEFMRTMQYEDQSCKTRDEFLQKHCSAPWIRDLHETLNRFINKNTLTVGLGSGFGEHELLFHLKGYRIIASDIISNVGSVTRELFADFKTATIDIFKDNVAGVIKTALPDPGPLNYDIMDTGLLFYYDDEKAAQIFKKFNENLNSGSSLILVSRYRDYFGAGLLEYLLKYEAWLKSKIKKTSIVKKMHGYRRTDADIIKLAKNAGFTFERSEATMFGYECTRSAILGKKIFFGFFRFTDRLFPVFNAATVFKFTKK